MDEFNFEARAGALREPLLKRLVDVVRLPNARLPAHERLLAGDILLDMLFDASPAERALCADRLKTAAEAPRRLLRYLALCEFEVAKPLLDENMGFDASDLRQVASEGGPEHRVAIAARRPVSEAVADAIIEAAEPEAALVLLRNRAAALSERGMDHLVALSRDHNALCGPILTRGELRPSQAMAMFWWADTGERRLILSRYAADRIELIDACADLFAQAEETDWTDPVTRKTLQMIERRQRNRAALERSAYDSLEHAFATAEVEGMSPAAAQEIGYLCGVKPVAIAQILSDVGGEGIAVLCKATGLKREALRSLWRALRRPETAPGGAPHPLFENLIEVYETLPTARAQTTLRYWNWSLTSASSPAQLGPAADNDSGENEEFSAAKRTARLVFGR